MSIRTQVTQSTEMEWSEAATAQQKRAVSRAAAFAYAAIVTVLFNTVLALTKDAYAPLNQFMARLSGHHWITHAIFDLLVFFATGLTLASRGLPKSGLGERLPVQMVCAVVIAGAGLGAWFLFF